MRKYTFVFASGRTKEFDAESESINNGFLVLANEKKQTSDIVSAHKEYDIVRVICLANLEDYGYVEIA